MVDTTSTVYVTLTAQGGGTASLRGVRPGMIRRVSKVTCELPTVGSGTLSLRLDGRQLVSQTITLRQVAVGTVDLSCGQQLDAVLELGPALVSATIRFYYRDVWE